MRETFYTTTSTLSFALLGFWWVVVQFKHQSWMPEARHRRMAYDVSLHFLLPGIMSLIALLTEGAPLLWRSVFVIAAVTGAYATFSIMRAVKADATQVAAVKVTRWVFLLCYALIAVVAAVPTIVIEMGLTLDHFQVEGILIALLIFLDVNVAWWFFSEPESPSSDPR